MAIDHTDNQYVVAVDVHHRIPYLAHHLVGFSFLVVTCDARKSHPSVVVVGRQGAGNDVGSFLYDGNIDIHGVGVAVAVRQKNEKSYDDGCRQLFEAHNKSECFFDVHDVLF